MEYVKVFTQDQRISIGVLQEFEGELMILSVKNPEKFKTGDILSCVYDEFTFQSNVLKISNNLLYIFAPIIKNNFIIDRRKYPRLEVSLSGFVNDCINEFIYDVPPEQLIEITDITIEGFGFTCEQRLKIGTPYILHVNLGNNMITKPKVIIENKTELENKKTRYGCRISQIDESEYRILRFYILTQQINLRSTEAKSDIKLEED